MTSDMLSQEEIESLLTGDLSMEPEVEFFEDESEVELLSEMEKDALGEIGNISMGTAATTLSTLLNRKVNITTPKVTVTSADELANEYKMPFVAVDVSYKEGLQGSNILILHSDDVKVITDLMMGKDEIDIERDITELDLSAAGEAMNQMMGSSSTSLSEMFMKKIDIEPPKSVEITFADGKKTIDLLKTSSPIIKISFKMEIGEFIDSNMMQLIPIEFGKDMVNQLINLGGVEEIINPINMEEPLVGQPTLNKRKSTKPIAQKPRKTVARMEDMNYNNEISIEEDQFVVTKPKFQNFGEETSNVYNEQIDLVGDIPIELTVELGRTHRKISEILEFGLGTVIELEKLVGEALNIYANGKYIAKGEVVVIDDNFGVRVTEIGDNHKQIL